MVQMLETEMVMPIMAHIMVTLMETWSLEIRTVMRMEMRMLETKTAITMATATMGV